MPKAANTGESAKLLSGALQRTNRGLGRKSLVVEAACLRPESWPRAAVRCHLADGSRNIPWHERECGSGLMAASFRVVGTCAGTAQIEATKTSPPNSQVTQRIESRQAHIMLTLDPRHNSEPSCYEQATAACVQQLQELGKYDCREFNASALVVEDPVGSIVVFLSSSAFALACMLHQPHGRFCCCRAALSICILVNCQKRTAWTL